MYVNLNLCIQIYQYINKKKIYKHNLINLSLFCLLESKYNSLKKNQKFQKNNHNLSIQVVIN